MRKTKNGPRLLAILLTLVMLLGLIPAIAMPAAAADDSIEAQSATKTLTITNHPVSTTLIVGNITGSLGVRVDIDPEDPEEGPWTLLGYQWYQNTTDSNIGGTLIATSANLAIPTNLTTGTYYYYVIVSADEAESAKSDAATITVNASSGSGSGSGSGGDPTITVSFSLLSANKHGGSGSVATLKYGGLITWISKRSYTLPANATVLDLLEKAMNEDAASYSLVNWGNYIGSITRNGVELALMDNGPNSGWMFTLNGEAPLWGVEEQRLKNGDTVVFHYSDDYTKEDASQLFDPPSGGGGGTSGKPEEPKEPEKPEEQNKPDDSGAPSSSGGNTADSFTDINTGDWYYEAVKFACENGLMNGTSADSFSPNTPLTRAMLITILARATNVDTTEGETWYSEALAWGIESKITDGANIGDNITREQFVTMLYRYAQLLGLDVSASADIIGYADAGEVSEWALEAMQWAIAAGLIQGRTDAEIAPGGTATRAEAATLLMRFLENLL